MEFRIEQKDPAWITKRLYGAMIDALFRQKLITETQRRGLQSALQCESAEIGDRIGGNCREEND